jgi:hypothetical protein
MKLLLTAIIAAISLAAYILKRFWSKEAVRQREIKRLEAEIEQAEININLVLDNITLAIDRNDTDNLNRLQAVLDGLRARQRTINARLIKIRGDS